MKKYRDHYFKKAKQESYPARSVYKLKEIQNRFTILRPGQSVLDLGAAPGSWSRFAAEKVGSKGSVLAVDLKESSADLPGQVHFIQADLLDPGRELTEALEERYPLDVVLSDMAPQTTGIKIRDQARSLELAEVALVLARQWLKVGGGLVVKIFDGPDVPEFRNELRRSFGSLKTFKPKSSRAESKETFFVAQDFKG